MHCCTVPVVGVLELEVEPVPNVPPVWNLLLGDVAHPDPAVGASAVSPHLHNKSDEITALLTVPSRVAALTG